MTAKKPPEEKGRPGRPPGGQGAKKGSQCSNGHTSNTDGQCFESSCDNYVRKGL